MDYILNAIFNHKNPLNLQFPNYAPRQSKSHKKYIRQYRETHQYLPNVKPHRNYAVKIVFSFNIELFIFLSMASWLSEGILFCIYSFNFLFAYFVNRAIKIKPCKKISLGWEMRVVVSNMISRFKKLFSTQQVHTSCQ